jgi:gluconolactonase
VDIDGNNALQIKAIGVVISTFETLPVFDPAGTLIGIIRLPEYPANCAWGGSDNQTMFFTANTSIYSLRMTTPGTRIPRA